MADHRTGYYTAESLAHMAGVSLERLMSTATAARRALHSWHPPAVAPRAEDIAFLPQDAAAVLMELAPAHFVTLSEAVTRLGRSPDQVRRAAGAPLIDGLLQGDALYQTVVLDAAWRKLSAETYLHARLAFVEDEEPSHPGAVTPPDSASP
ncbi:MAG: hypothetical protein NVSMB65_15570 [Chloroflexota bacterium]